MSSSRSMLIAGFGSPHGDDQAGWRLVAMLRQRPGLAARTIIVHESTQLFSALDGCRRLVILDACHSGGTAGSITRLRWPSPQIVEQHSHSSHALGVPDTLRLAAALGLLPPRVDVYGIEVADVSPGSDLSPAVLQAVCQLEQELLNEIGDQSREGEAPAELGSTRGSAGASPSPEGASPCRQGAAPFPQGGLSIAPEARPCMSGR